MASSKAEPKWIDYFKKMLASFSRNMNEKKKLRTVTIAHMDTRKTFEILANGLDSKEGILV